MTLRGLVDDYLQNHEPRRQAEARWFGDSGLTQEGAIQRACLSQFPNDRDCLVRHGHQTRLKGVVLSEAARALKARGSELEKSSDFAELIDVVDRSIGAIYGAGPMLVYDVAERFGTYAGLRPEKVYLHRGTRDGAAELNPAFRRRDTLEMHELSKELRRLTPTQIEDFLCLYKDWLSGDRAGRPKGCWTKSGRLRPVRPC
jgi:hypothetical protein